MRARTTTAAGLLAVAALIAAACGGGTDPTVPADGSPATAAATAGQDCPTGVQLPSGTDIRGSSPAAGGTVSLRAGDQFFDPTCVTGLEPGSTVRVTVENVGESLHNIQIEDQDIDRDVAVGESTTVQVTVPESGAVTFVCKYHTSLGMNGALVASS